MGNSARFISSRPSCRSGLDETCWLVVADEPMQPFPCEESNNESLPQLLDYDKVIRLSSCRKKKYYTIRAYGEKLESDISLIGVRYLTRRSRASHPPESNISQIGVEYLIRRIRISH